MIKGGTNEYENGRKTVTIWKQLSLMFQYYIQTYPMITIPLVSIFVLHEFGTFWSTLFHSWREKDEASLAVKNNCANFVPMHLIMACDQAREVHAQSFWTLWFWSFFEEHLHHLSFVWWIWEHPLSSILIGIGAVVAYWFVGQASSWYRIWHQMRQQQPQPFQMNMNATKEYSNVNTTDAQYAFADPQQQPHASTISGFSDSPTQYDPPHPTYPFPTPFTYTPPSSSSQNRQYSHSKYV